MSRAARKHILGIQLDRTIADIKLALKKSGGPLRRGETLDGRLGDGAFKIWDAAYRKWAES